ncbi:hypothetical protein [Salmonella enterica]
MEEAGPPHLSHGGIATTLRGCAGRTVPEVIHARTDRRMQREKNRL